VQIKKHPHTKINMHNSTHTLKHIKTKKHTHVTVNIHTYKHTPHTQTQTLTMDTRIHTQ